MRIGILGSKADPWHTDHLLVGERAYEQYRLDWVYLMPSGLPPDKKTGVTDKEVRWAFTKAVARKNKHFKPSRIEIDREGPSFMVDTLRALRKQHGNRAKLFLIIGEDRAPTLKDWHQIDEVVKLCEFLVAPRAHGVITREMIEPMMPPKAKFDIITIERSSTYIRAQVAAGKSIRYLVPDEEIRLIEKHCVYGAKKKQKKRRKQ